MRIAALVPGVEFAFAWTEYLSVQARHVGLWRLDLELDTAARRNNIAKRLAKLGPTEVVYEVFGGIEGCGGSCFDTFVDDTERWCDAADIPRTPFLRGEVKRHATGFPDAAEREIVAGARDRFGWQGIDPRQAHALWLLDAYVERLRRTGTR